MKAVRSSFFAVLAIAFIALLANCSKPAFKSEKGLYSLKQYHCYLISGTDTGRLADVKISTMAEDNVNYVLWNNISFHLNFGSDSVSTYIHDTAVDGVTQILYTLTYVPKTDKIVVMGNTINKMWRSF